ncbi:MAG: hypothetical protein K8F92_16700 [Hyphomicrobium sp.]|uniref:hypothetical protein n=1 Tax=Hyphomicrobium sp. TaxID=82 RepID=UPI00132A9FB9|nr:hypothetical protein [Hyphomicrobium sp.]KAB2938275.1 MAG: hypothetical protein F9K20_19020 [Hyphomicrobium sp.]MBZ0211272.1 hypothetical protein [Hyphomicrobium sp.]
MSADRGPYRKSYIVPHGSGFKYLRAIPKDLQPLEKNKQAWVKYLGPVSRTEAATLAHALAHEHGRRIMALRALSPVERATAIAAGGFDSWRELARAADLLPAAQMADVVSFDADRAVPGQEREPATPLAAQMAVGSSASLSLLALVELWETVRSPRSPIGRAKVGLCVRRFIDLVGNLPAHEITRAHAVAYRDALEQLPGMKPKNLAEHLSRMHALFAVAMSEGILTANPLDSVKARELGNALAPRRQGFTAEHVRAIFAALSSESETFGWVVRKINRQIRMLLPSFVASPTSDPTSALALGR